MTAPLLEARSLSRHFGGVVALDGLNLEVREGEILGLIGPNGSGKTTFFNVVTGIFPATQGAVVFAGADITGFTPQAVYGAGIARTFQRSRLCLELSIFDNIVLGAHKTLNRGIWFNTMRRRAFRAEHDRQHAAAHDLLRTFDAALADRMSEPTATLPMIQRRRIEVCRALISQPRLLLLDEPSAGMTHDETRHLMDDILSMRGRIPGLSIVIIEQEMNVIERITDRCVVLNFGQKIFEGTYREVASDRKVQEAYLGVE
jgi:branched-chain amino acid transport system ATP-binding protein